MLYLYMWEFLVPDGVLHAVRDKGQKQSSWVEGKTWGRKINELVLCKMACHATLQLPCLSWRALCVDMIAFVKQSSSKPKTHIAVKPKSHAIVTVFV